MLGLYPLSGAPLGSSGDANPIVSTISGNQATGSAGTLTSENSNSITGNQAIGAVGTATANIIIALTGVEATGQVGTEGEAVTVALTGVQATGAVGSVGVNVVAALTGVEATGAVGSVNVSADIVVALTGVEATGQVGILTVQAQPIIVIDDTHDGDFLGKKFAEEQARAAKRREAILNAYEIVVEGRPEFAEEIAEPFTQLVVDQQEMPVKQIDYDALFADLDRVEAIWSNYIDLDDEEILALL
jgi:hypothetical protein